MSCEEMVHLPASLAPVPRSVSVGGRLALFFYGTGPFVAVFFALLGMFLLGKCNYRDYILDFEPVSERGIITSFEETRMNANKRHVYRVQFEIPGLAEAQVRYTFRRFEPGYTCDMERHQSTRFGTIYRPVETTLGEFGRDWVFLAISSLFTLGAGGLSVYMIRKGVKILHTLRYGNPIYVRETERRDTGLRVNGMPVFRVVFRGVSEEGTSCEHTVKTVNVKLLDENRDFWLLVDQTGYVVWLDHFLERFQLTRSGDFRLKFGTVVRFLIVATVEVGAVGLFWKYGI
ncbi:MAG: hypothetical protein Q4C70_07955 [Planctomycetia bacterium]|nr:hypothetical protein [Planctomycetia bacterium]